MPGSMKGSRKGPVAEELEAGCLQHARRFGADLLLEAPTLQGLPTDVGSVRCTNPPRWRPQQCHLAGLPQLFMNFQLRGGIAQAEVFGLSQAPLQGLCMLFQIAPQCAEIGIVKQWDTSYAQSLHEVLRNSERRHAGFEVHHNPPLAIVEAIGSGDQGAPIDLPLRADKAAVVQVR